MSNILFGRLQQNHANAKIICVNILNRVVEIIDESALLLLLVSATFGDTKRSESVKVIFDKTN